VGGGVCQLDDHHIRAANTVVLWWLLLVSSVEALCIPVRSLAGEACAKPTWNTQRDVTCMTGGRLVLADCSICRHCLWGDACASLAHACLLLMVGCH
jgi:hypothetical protein